MYDWNSISWQKLEKGVFKLQKRIYQASCCKGRSKTAAGLGAE
jgi:hypothetical protein